MLGTKWKPIPPQHLKTTFSLPHGHPSVMLPSDLFCWGQEACRGDLLTNLYPENLSFPF